MGFLDDLSGPESAPDTSKKRAGEAAPAPKSGGFLDSLTDQPEAQAEPEPSSLWDAAKEAGKGIFRGAGNFAGDIGEAVMGPFGPSHHAANLMADLGLRERPPTEPTYGQQIAKASGWTEASPQTEAGKYAGAAAEVAGNPASYIGPGGIPAKIAGALLSGAGSEAAGEATKGTVLETPARIAGGLLGGAAAGQVSSVVNNTMRARAIPTTVELERAADHAYGAARSLGVEYDTPKVQNLQNDIEKSLLKDGYRADKSAGTFNRIKEITDPPTPANKGGNRDFSDIEGVRQSLNRVRKEVDPQTGMATADASAAGKAIEKIDDFLGDPSNAITAHRQNAQLAAKYAEIGRGNWAAMSRSKQVEQAISKGELNAGSSGSGANVDNALRQQIKSILNSPRRLRGFSADDRAIMNDIVLGNPVRNSARLVGKMAATGIVSAAGVEYLSHLMGLGPAGHLLLPAAGYLAKKSGDVATKNRINRLLQSIRADSPLGSARNIPDRSSGAPFALRSLATMPEQTEARGGRIARALRATKKK